MATTRFETLRQTVATRFLIAAAGVMLVLAPPLADAETAPLAPEFSAEHWLNTEPLAMADLRRQVVLVEFWTFDCYKVATSSLT